MTIWVCLHSGPADLLFFPYFQIPAWRHPLTVFNTCSYKCWGFFCFVLKYTKQQKRKDILKRKWQLPQLLAGALIKTKLVSFSEQTWQALSRGAFFPLLPKYKVSAGAPGMSTRVGARQSWPFSLSIVYVRLHMRVYVCICACVSSKPWLFSRMLWLHGRGAYPAVCLSAPLQFHRGRKLEQKQMIVMLFGRGWGLP